MRLILLLFLLCFNLSFSQENTNKYLPADLASLEIYLKKINENHTNKISGEFSSKIKKVFKNRDEKIFESIKDSNYVFNPTIQKNLDAILENIYKSNPEINTTDFRFFIKNSIIPNAACYGDGMFEIHLGLFTSLEYDDELAFIICHEIAHKLLEHSMKNISKRVATINSKETKDKVKGIKKSMYGQGRAALALIDELSINMIDYSKEVEAEADSLGFVLFSKTSYSNQQAISSLSKLELKDDMVLYHDIKVDSIFNFDTFPFKSYWLKESTSLFDTSKKINEFALVSDTLKTHPEIEFRINKLIKEFNIKETSPKGTKLYLNEINKQAHFESVSYTIDLKFLDLAIYQLVQKFENNLIGPEYYYSTMAEVLKRIYLAKKNHELGKYVPPKNNFSDEKQLNTIRLFLHNLELNEVTKLGLVFCETNMNKFQSNVSFETTYNFFKTINN